VGKHGFSRENVVARGVVFSLFAKKVVALPRFLVAGIIFEAFSMENLV
jgi:hypothetical protein